MLKVCSEEDNLAIALVKTSQVYGHPMQYAGMEVDPKTESVLYHAPFGIDQVETTSGYNGTRSWCSCKDAYQEGIKVSHWRSTLHECIGGSL